MPKWRRRLAANEPEPLPDPHPVGHRLHYTGTLSSEQFDAACQRQYHWYHSYYFDNGFEIRGHYNVGPDIDSYGFPHDLEGKTVPDIGTGSGWFAHYLHQRGAIVTATDARGLSDFDMFGRYRYPAFSSERREPDRHDEHGGPVYF